MRLATALTIAALSLPAYAQERVGSFVLLDDVPEVIVLAGDITPLTPLDFKKAMLRRPDAQLLVLASQGGNLVGGLVLADDVHERGLATYIPPQVGCYSACAYVFFGGTSRLAAGELGVHQFSGPDGGDDASAQWAVADLLEIMGRFEVPPVAIDKMLRTAADDIYVFSDREISENGINVDSTAVRLAASVLDDLPEETVETLMAEGTAEPEETVAKASPSQKAAGVAPAFAVFEDVDLYGGDIEKISVADFPLCVSACLDNDMCVAVTFNTTTRPSRGPNCFVKDGSADPVEFEGAVTGIFMDANLDMGLRVGRKTIQPVDVIRGD